MRSKSPQDNNWQHCLVCLFLRKNGAFRKLGPFQKLVPFLKKIAQGLFLRISSCQFKMIFLRGNLLWLIFQNHVQWKLNCCIASKIGHLVNIGKYVLLQKVCFMGHANSVFSLSRGIMIFYFQELYLFRNKIVKISTLFCCRNSETNLSSN